jgi:hypothetical protein
LPEPGRQSILVKSVSLALAKSVSLALALALAGNHCEGKRNTGAESHDTLYVA